MNKLITHVEYWPSFGITTEQAPLGLYTVLSVNESIGDCAAYRGIGPMSSTSEEPWVTDAVARGGKKISKFEAIDLFPEIERHGWRYRN
jgi:hypothetical protein